MNVLVDTNVWLDVFARRQPFYDQSARALSLLEGPDHAAFLGATTVTTLHYLLERHLEPSQAMRHIESLLQRHRVVGVDGIVLRDALESGGGDYEDAVLEQAALRAGADAIMTRNAPDFSCDQLAVYTPTEFLAANAP